MNEKALTPIQLGDAKILDETLVKLANIKEELKQYKLNDVYILEEWDTDAPQRVWVEKTSLDLPAKYKVVWISPEGVPYLRKITSAGNPTGGSRLPPEITSINILQALDRLRKPGEVYLQQRFVLDPEQVDSILLQTEYDPMAQNRTKSKLLSEINKHNKRVQIPTDYYRPHAVPAFFKAKQPGDKFWTSPDKQFVIQSVIKTGKQWIITALDMNQAIVTFNFSSFCGRRLYKEQPRAFSKEVKT